jgi:hypothetical protein
VVGGGGGDRTGRPRKQEHRLSLKGGAKKVGEDGLGGLGGALQWADLVTQLGAAYPEAINSCLIDMLNEPDCWGLSWQASNGYPSSGDLYLAAMDAIYAVNSGTPPPSRSQCSVPLFRFCSFLQHFAIIFADLPFCLANFVFWRVLPLSWKNIRTSSKILTIPLASFQARQL